MSAFGRAAGGTAPLPCWNPDETTLELLVMKSGHRTKLLPDMTFNLHTCRSSGMRWLQIAHTFLLLHVALFVFQWDVTKIERNTLLKKKKTTILFYYFPTISDGWCFVCIHIWVVRSFTMQSPSSQSSLHRTQVLHQAHNCLTLIPLILSVHIIPHAAYGKDLSLGVSVQTKTLTNCDPKIWISCG